MAIVQESARWADAADSIHLSKITVPRVRKRARVDRPALVRRIDEGTRGPLTLLSAPAGWGKSTLLTEWAETTPSRVTWLCVDESDNNPTRFLRSLVWALQRSAGIALDDVQTMLRSSQPVPSRVVLRAILDALESASFDHVIVLDDVHAITAPEVRCQIAELLDFLPDHVHLLIATRGAPALPLGRLRAEGSLTTIDMRDLRFSLDEAAHALGSFADGPLETDDIALLVERTEGWIAGLQLAALTLRHAADASAAIARFRGTHRDVVEYFGEEVLTHLPPDSRQFLIQTSILDRLTVPLCDAVTGRTDSAQRLQELCAANLFLIPLDDEGITFRYHGLFRDLLGAELARVDPAGPDRLHARASAWFENEQMYVEAVHHAILAGDAERAADLMDRAAEPLMYVCGQTNQVIQWVESLPSRMLPQYPNLVRLYAWALTLVGRLADADDLVQRIEQTADCSEPDRAYMRGQLAAIRARVASYRADHQGTIALGEAALAVLDPQRDGQLKTEVLLSIGFAHRALGRSAKAAEAFADAARIGETTGNVRAGRWGVRYLAATWVEQGRLRDAAALLDDELERANRTDPPGGSDSQVALLIGQVEIALHHNDLVRARRLVDTAFPIVRASGDAKMLMNVYVALGNLEAAEGRLDDADRSMRRADQIFPGPIRGCNVARLALRRGDHLAAGRWAQTSGFSLGDDADSARGESDQVLYARIMMTTEPGSGAEALAERLLADAEAGGRFGRAIEVLIALSLGAHRRGDADLSMRHAQRALELGQPEGFVRVFLDEGAEFAAVLRRLVREHDRLSPRLRAFALELIAATGADAAQVPAETAAGLVEPLTDRQVEILRLLAEGQSNRQIGAQLFIAEGTVKAHLHQLFGKLMARNRTEAVASARSLGLIR